MGRKKDPKTETLYCYLRPRQRLFVKSMRQYFKSESNYIDALVAEDMKHKTMKNLLLEVMKNEKQTEKALELLKDSKAHDCDPISHSANEE